MRVAVNSIPVICGSQNDQMFGYNLLNHLPGAMPESTLFYEQDHEGGLPSAPNVQPIAYRGDVADSIYFSPYGNVDYFPELHSGVIALNDIDEQVFAVPKWWRFGREPQDYLKEALQNATALIVPHTTLRQAIIDRYSIPSTKIHLVGHGLPPTDQQITPADSVTRRITKEVYGNEHSYFLAPATRHPSDNLERLFAAYDLFRQRCQEPVRLLVEQPELGKHPKLVKKAWKQAQQKQDIVFLPVLSQAERRKVVSSARAILHPSLSTAFPLPVLDAWTAEVPVLGTDNKVMQGAGALVQGTDVKSIAEGMVALVTTPFLASGLVENGKRRRADFSWEDVAQRVAEVLRSV
jgi:glycosyltransferase involved in cell wall biosynthesis